VLAEAVAEIERETFTAPTARKYLSQLLAIATGEELVSYYSLETWTEEWLRRKARDSSKATMARYKSHSEAFLSWLGPERRKKPLESITALDARKWREAAYELLGIAKPTFYRWLQEGEASSSGLKRDFCDAIKRARAVSTATLTKGISDDSGWQAKAWLLERMYPKEYGRRRAEVLGI
jgi:hypothetical protein